MIKFLFLFVEDIMCWILVECENWEENFKYVFIENLFIKKIIDIDI